MLLPKMPREGFGGLQTTLGLGALFVDHADQRLHRHAERACCASEPRLVVGIDVADSDAGTHVGGSDSVKSRLATDQTCSSISPVSLVFQRRALSELRYAPRKLPFKPVSAERGELDPFSDLSGGPAAAQAPSRPRVETADVDAWGLRAFCPPCHGRTSTVVPLFALMMEPAGRKGQFDGQRQFASDVLEPAHAGGAGVRTTEGVGRTRQT